MIQLQIVSGRQAGSDIVVRRFPFMVGRGSDAALRLDDAGVWDQHLEIKFEPTDGFTFVTQPSALTLVNGERVECGALRNGDTLELGSAQLRFWLARTQQRTLRTRETLTWTALFAVFGAQIGIYLLVVELNELKLGSLQNSPSQRKKLIAHEIFAAIFPAPFGRDFRDERTAFVGRPITDRPTGRRTDGLIRLQAVTWEEVIDFYAS